MECSKNVGFCFAFTGRMCIYWFSVGVVYSYIYDYLSQV